LAKNREARQMMSSPATYFINDGPRSLSQLVRTMIETQTTKWPLQFLIQEIGKGNSESAYCNARLVGCLRTDGLSYERPYSYNIELEIEDMGYFSGIYYVHMRTGVLASGRFFDKRS